MSKTGEENPAEQDEEVAEEEKPETVTATGSKSPDAAKAPQSSPVGSPIGSKTQSGGPAKDTSPSPEVSHELEEEKMIKKELDQAETEQEVPEKMKQEIADASKLKIKPTPDAVKQEPASPEPALKKTKLEDDIKRWKSTLLKATQLSAATPINDEDYLINREGYKLNREKEFATGHHSKLYKCKKDSVEQILKITPLKNINLKYKANLLKNAVIVMKFLQDNNHPSLVQHFAWFQSPVKMYIFMEPLSGIDLNSYIKKNRKPTSATYLQKVKRFGRHVAEGINHLFVLGMAHCNIKTVNVCLSLDLSSAKIVGFNHSKLIYNPIKEQEVLAPKEVEWSYNHAPESQKGPYRCVPAEVWAFGVLIVCMLTGEFDFKFIIIIFDWIHE